MPALPILRKGLIFGIIVGFRFPFLLCESWGSFLLIHHLVPPTPTKGWKNPNTCAMIEAFFLFEPFPVSQNWRTREVLFATWLALPPVGVLMQRRLGRRSVECVIQWLRRSVWEITQPVVGRNDPKKKKVMFFLRDTFRIGIIPRFLFKNLFLFLFIYLQSVCWALSLKLQETNVAAGKNS